MTRNLEADAELAQWLRNSPDVSLDEPHPHTAVSTTMSPELNFTADDGFSWHTLEKVRLQGTMPEYRFALNYLEVRVEQGVSLGWLHEPLAIRMKGQTYTPDFIEFTADGRMFLYEVKGHQKLGSQDRASVKFRFTAALFESDNVVMLWAKESEHGGFLVKPLPMQGKRQPHPDLKGVK